MHMIEISWISGLFVWKTGEKKSTKREFCLS